MPKEDRPSRGFFCLTEEVEEEVVSVGEGTKCWPLSPLQEEPFAYNSGELDFFFDEL